MLWKVFRSQSWEEINSPQGTITSLNNEYISLCVAVEQHCFKATTVFFTQPPLFLSSDTLFHFSRSWSIEAHFDGYLGTVK